MQTSQVETTERPRISRISSLFPIAEALLGAASSDRPPSDAEHAAIRTVLCELLGVTHLPLRLEERLAAFNPESLDLQAIAEDLERRPVIGRRSLIELTRQVCDADGDLDLSEDRFMLALSLALSLEPEEVDHVVYDSPFRGFKRVLKRLEDVSLGVLFLLVCAVPMLAIALAIRLTSRGPVLFRQLRHGRDGVPFHVLKFRSMRALDNGVLNNVADGAWVTQAQRNDPRITRVGAFLRRTSLDELPQFLNVIAGTMSLVGPRPHAIAHNALYRTKILEYMRRHKVKPGITGWAQVNGLRGETDTLDKMVARVDHDLHYIRHWSLWLDVKIIFLTVFGRKVRQNAY